MSIIHFLVDPKNPNCAKILRSQILLSAIGLPAKSDRVITFKGGDGSGNFGHAGRPGKQGGSARARGESSVSAVLADWEKQNYKKEIEHGLAVASDGYVIFNVVGEKDRIDLSDKQEGLLRGAIFTHNHPWGWEYPQNHVLRAGTSFSPGDVIVFADKGLREIRAISPRYTHILRWKNENIVINERLMDNPEAHSGFMARIERGLRDAELSVRVYLKKEIYLRSMSVDEANTLHHHLMMDRLFNTDEIDSTLNRFLDYERIEHGYR